MIRRKPKAHRPPRDLFVPGSVASLTLAILAFAGVFGTSAEASRRANAKVADLYESCAPGTSQSALVARLGYPNSESSLGSYRLLKFEKPRGFEYEIDVIMRGPNVYRIIAIESDRHRMAVEQQVNKLRGK